MVEIEEFQISKNAQYELHRETVLRIDILSGCSLARVKLQCQIANNYWLNDLYNINVFETAWNEYCTTRNNSGHDIDINSFDGNLWNSVTNCLEKYRQEINNTLLEVGVIAVDAHFLSIKFSIDTIKKFRGKFYNAFNADKSTVSYHKTFFRPCFILLIERMDRMTPKKTYLYTKKAANTIGYRREAARLCATMLEEETLAIITSKLLT